MYMALYGKLSTDASRVCVAAVLRELQMMHVSTEHKQRVWTKWPALPYTLIFILSGVDKFYCWGFKFFKDVKRICVAAVLRKLWCVKVLHADFWTNKTAGWKLGVWGACSSGGPGGSGPSGGIKGGRRPQWGDYRGATAPFNKKGHILELKKALKINFSVFSAAVRSLVAPTVHNNLEPCSVWSSPRRIRSSSAWWPT